MTNTSDPNPSTPRSAGRLAVELDEAIASGGLTLAYQPLVDLRTFQVHGLEALARWYMPGEGCRPPDRWVRTAEEHGLIVRFGNWALRTVVEHMATLRQAGFDRVRVAVNLSPLQLDEPDFIPLLVEQLERWEVPAGFLDLELTERHFRMGADRLRPALEALRLLGCHVHLDDYGTGDSSLQSLFDLPIDAIKIDRAFVRGLPQDVASAAIVDSTVMMAHRMGLQVIAEGIEVLEQADFLRQIGCDLAQGFLFSRPVAFEALPATLARWGRELRRFERGAVESTVGPWDAEPAVSTRLEGVRVVVLDDEPAVSGIAEAVLQHAGADVAAVNDVAQAIALVTAEQPDVVLFDVHMPGLSGWEFMKLIRHSAPEIRLVAVSGHVEERMRAMYRPDAVVPKPYRAATLVRAVHDVLTRPAGHTVVA